MVLLPRAAGRQSLEIHWSNLEMRRAFVLLYILGVYQIKHGVSSKACTFCPTGDLRFSRNDRLHRTDSGICDLRRKFVSFTVGYQSPSRVSPGHGLQRRTNLKLKSCSTETSTHSFVMIPPSPNFGSRLTKLAVHEISSVVSAFDVILPAPSSQVASSVSDIDASPFDQDDTAPNALHSHSEAKASGAAAAGPAFVPGRVLFNSRADPADFCRLRAPESIRAVLLHRPPPPTLSPTAAAGDPAAAAGGVVDRLAEWIERSVNWDAALDRLRQFGSRAASPAAAAGADPAAGPAPPPRVHVRCKRGGTRFDAGCGPAVATRLAGRLEGRLGWVPTVVRAQADVEIQARSCVCV